MTHSLDLTLPAAERRWAAALAGRWADFLYVPGPGFASPLEPGLYTSSFVIAPEDGPAVRVSSLVVPAFGGDLCRLRLEPVVSFRLESLGSFFDTDRRGTVYATSDDRRGGVARPPDRPGWSYEGPPLAERLGAVTHVRVLRERVAGGIRDGAFSWVADRGLVLTGAGGEETLLLAQPTESEHAVLVPASGLYRVLLDPGAPAVPGATQAEILGYGDWPSPLDIEVEVGPLTANLDSVC